MRTSILANLIATGTPRGHWISDVFYWDPLMAGALLGSIPVAIVYAFFVEHYVAVLTGVVKG